MLFNLFFVLISQGLDVPLSALLLLHPFFILFENGLQLGEQLLVLVVLRVEGHALAVLGLVGLRIHGVSILALIMQTQARPAIAGFTRSRIVVK